MYGFVAGVVAAYRGLNPAGGPKGVGDAVNQAVVITFLLLFLINLLVSVVTTVQQLAAAVQGIEAMSGEGLPSVTSLQDHSRALHAIWGFVPAADGQPS